MHVDNPREAARLLRPAIPIAREQLSGYQQATSLLAAAKIAVVAGQASTGARLLGAFAPDGTGKGLIGGWYFEEYERLVLRVRTRLGAAASGDELDAGAQLSVAQALRLAEDLLATVG